jgi:hypothetical protein
MTAASAFSAIGRGEEGGVVAALAQLRDAQLDRPRARLPGAVAIAVAVIDPGLAGPVRSAGEALNLELHQALRGKANHLAQQLGIRALL